MRRESGGLFGFALLPLFILITGCATDTALANISVTGIMTDTTDTAPAIKEEKTTGPGDNDGKIDEDTFLKKIDESKISGGESETSLLMGDDQLIRSELERILSDFGEDEEVPQVFFDEVEGYVRIFQKNIQYRKFVTASLKRSSKHMALVKEIFGRKGIPEEMAYIAFIESGFNPRASSQAGAMGMWQFIPGTARNYALKVGKNLDERLDPVRSTYAAADYFHDLMAIFGPRSFLLAMAAYNSGEGKIISCLKGIENPFEERNFWHIRPCLSKETREYPPKIIAASIIGNNPEAFGFPRYEENQDYDLDPIITAEYNPPRTKAIHAVYTKPAEPDKGEAPTKNNQRRGVTKQKPILYSVKKGNRLDSIAEAFGVDVADIKRWNKKRNSILMDGEKLKLYPAKPMECVNYKVRKADTISEISETFRVRPSHIVLCSGLKNGLQIRAGQTLVFYRQSDHKPLIHVVKKGTNLARISEKYKVRMKDVMMWNNMMTTTVYAGQKLKIYTRTSQEA